MFQFSVVGPRMVNSWVDIMRILQEPKLGKCIKITKENNYLINATYSNINPNEISQLIKHGIYHDYSLIEKLRSTPRWYYLLTMEYDRPLILSEYLKHPSFAELAFYVPSNRVYNQIHAGSYRRLTETELMDICINFKEEKI